MTRGKKSLFFVLILIVVLLVGCADKKLVRPDENTGIATTDETGKSVEGETSTTGSGYDTRDLVAELSDRLIQAIMKKDASVLSASVHLTKGLRISPYGYVEPQSDPVFKASQIKNLFSSNDKIDWGVMDETGKPVLLTVSQYFDEYLVSKYASPGSRATEDTLDGSNITELYRDSVVIEHMCGEQKDGAYDNIIILVYENFEDKWYLTGIVPVMVEN